VDAFGDLHALLADPTITEVLVNAARDVWIEREGRLHRCAIRMSPGQADHMVERVIAPLGLRFDRSSPMVDARLGDGTRLHAVGAPVAVDGTCLSLRKFSVAAIPLAGFAPPPLDAWLVDAVRDRANIVVSGGTSSGKTTLLNSLTQHVPDGERIVTLEDAAELRLGAEHVVRLETRPATADGTGAINLTDLLRTALRLRPDRIVVGEVRGAEALAMVQAMNTGHDGSLTTVHANSARDALHRIESLALTADSGLTLDAVRRQVQRSIDLVVHVARVNGQRSITEVAAMTDDPAQPLRRLDGPWKRRTTRSPS
jgi:pilus assembly protein CpaF